MPCDGSVMGSVAAAMIRRLPSDPRIGKLRWWSVGGVRLLVSPDVYMWLWPSAITLGLAISFLYLLGGALWRTNPLGLTFFVAVVLTALGASLACGLTDPGIIPRLTQDQPDPYRDETGWVLCRQCQIRRPPRAAHCYVCGVCVLEHDHHCGVIGGCVGMRSLRWFALYLVCIGIACGIGCWWLAHSLWSMDFAHTIAHHPRYRRGVTTGPAPTRPTADPGLQFAGVLITLIFGASVLLVVGSLAVYYVVLVITDTTRREARHGVLSKASGADANALAYLSGLFYHEDKAQALHSQWSWRRLGRLGRVSFPVPSLVEEEWDTERV